MVMNDNRVCGLSDTHAHLSFLLKNESGGESILEEIARADFNFILDIGTNAGDLAERIGLLSKYSNVRFAAGIWPHKEDIARVSERIALLEEQIAAAPSGLLAAIGECGYDRREHPKVSAGETELFEMQLGLARRYKLPIVIHSREAPEETIATVRGYPQVKCIIHCFSYGPREAELFLELGCYISFAGNLTFKNAQNLRDAIVVVPKERLLLETDCPFLAPVPSRGKMCRPEMIIETYRCAAKLRNIPLDELTLTIAENVKTLFNYGTP
jgi:TatD DNase family protein